MAKQRTESISSEWQDEPDREDFEHAGYRCLILRNTNEELLHLNGYVGVAKGHPAYGMGYDGMPMPYEDLYQVEVHGGVTFAQEGDGKWPTGLWWLGFDCAHCGDLVPGVAMLIAKFADKPPLSEVMELTKMVEEITGKSMFDGETYKNFQYVRSEVKRLAEQLADLDFIDWQFTWVWPLLLPVRTARYFWKRR